jgi:hypothetical protein
MLGYSIPTLDRVPSMSLHRVTLDRRLRLTRSLNGTLAAPVAGIEFFTDRNDLHV